MAELKKPNPILLGLVIILLFILPLFVVIRGVWILKKTAPENLEEKVTSLDEKGVLKPSQVLDNKAMYAGKSLIVRGKVSAEPAVCAKKDCPVEDQCCGCPAERNLSLEGLRLMNEGQKPICQRKQGACDYDCGDWGIGQYYDVSGTFFYIPPPPSWKMALAYNLQVSGKTLLRNYRPAGKVGGLGAVFESIKKLFQKSKTSGYFLLP